MRDLPTVQSLSESVRCGTCGTSTDHFIIANDDLISVTDDSSSPLMPDPPTPSYSYQGADVEWSDSALRYALRRRDLACPVPDGAESAHSRLRCPAPHHPSSLPFVRPREWDSPAAASSPAPPPARLRPPGYQCLEVASPDIAHQSRYCQLRLRPCPGVNPRYICEPAPSLVE